MTSSLSLVGFILGLMFVLLIINKSKSAIKHLFLAIVALLVSIAYLVEYIYKSSIPRTFEMETSISTDLLYFIFSFLFIVIAIIEFRNYKKLKSVVETKKDE